jgi:rubrerythrin
MNKAQLEDLLLQALETEMGGVQIYTTALKCVVNKDLRNEWEEYLEQTQHHVEVVRQLLEDFSFDPEKMTPSREVVHHLGGSLVEAMQMAKANAPAEAAEIVACECVVLAETKDHSNWELLRQCAQKTKGSEAKALKTACDEVEEEEDEHLYHSKGWCRELAIAALGMKAVLPPPEEEKDVKTAIGAARAQQSREQML